jgi:predicted short-subunit dehydrogenase-like oxidoreductase (DUF2520 family)
MRVVIIGSGNVATVLGERIVIAGHDVLQVYGRHLRKATTLAKKLGAQATDSPTQLSEDADLYIISVTDSALTGIAQWLRTADKPVVHTAGSVDKEILKECSKHYGILYPLQSIRKEIDVLPEIPLLIDGESAETISLVFAFAQTISGMVQQANDVKRKQLHVAAVMINNFSNHLYTLAADFCRNENLDFKLLLPLISETAERLKTNTPAQVQTGPAIRNDMQTIATHLQLLEKYPELNAIYTQFTVSIINYYSTAAGVTISEQENS